MHAQVLEVWIYTCYFKYLIPEAVMDAEYQDWCPI